LNRLVVRAKIVGRRGLSAAPVELDLGAAVVTVRDLLGTIVREQVDAFRNRKQEAKVLRILTERDLAEGLEVGRITSGDQKPDDRVPDTQRAIEAALTAFEDGFYYMFVNETQMERLDQVVDQGELTDVLFVRLTPLAGG